MTSGEYGPPRSDESETESALQHSELPSPLPDTRADRVITVDLLRGVAVFGILSMNIISFALPAAAYRNPASVNDDSLLNHLLYSFFHIFADQKMMGLFSLLFGVSVMLFISKLREAGRGVKRWYYSRTLWLLLIGSAHGIFVWSGDILLLYAMCGLILYWFHRFYPSVQFVLGAVIFIGAISIDNMGQDYLEALPNGSLASLGEAIWSPNEFDIAYETAYIRGPYWTQVALRLSLPETYQSPSLLYVSNVVLAQGYARAFGLMLIGMAFYSWGIVTGAQSKRFYRFLASVGIGSGAVVSGYGLWQLYRHDWDFLYSMFAGMRYNHVATLLLVFGYVGLFAWLYRSGRLRWLVEGIAAVGRMAFTNYLTQSVLCTTLFYGFGLGLFGRLDRLQLLLVVVAIWTSQFLFSRWWLARFSYGPLEWIWRTLTYFRAQPLRRSSTKPGSSSTL